MGRQTGKGDGLSAAGHTSLFKYLLFRKMAERKGFEPSIPFPVYSLSRGAPSTTRPPLRGPHLPCFGGALQGRVGFKMVPATVCGSLPLLCQRDRAAHHADRL